MKAALEITKDGSHTVSLPEMNVLYHSRHGAVQESQHVFLQAGLHFSMQQKHKMTILEMGLGTGLNALLTQKEAIEKKIEVNYHCIEAYPLPWSFVQQLNYPAFLHDTGAMDIMEKIHTSPAGTQLILSPYFKFTKYHTTLQQFKMQEAFDVVYFDAFAPEAQPELWTRDIFEKLAGMMIPGGCLVTYCSKGSVRRAMQAAGWTVTKLPGPPGKREMVRALYLPG